MEKEDSSILDVCNFDDCAIFEIHLLLSIKYKTIFVTVAYISF
jgi:hypothetical protein